jgi:hypothetical protein
MLRNNRMSFLIIISFMSEVLIELAHHFPCGRADQGEGNEFSRSQIHERV